MRVRHFSNFCSLIKYINNNNTKLSLNCLLFLIFTVNCFRGKCHDLLEQMGEMIGKVNVYNIYDECNMNLSSPYSRTM